MASIFGLEAVTNFFIGSGKLVPKNVTDNSDPITVGKGDYLIFKRGFLCEWHIQERIRKRYCFFDENGEVVVGMFC